MIPMQWVTGTCVEIQPLAWRVQLKNGKVVIVPRNEVYEFAQEEDPVVGGEVALGVDDDWYYPHIEPETPLSTRRWIRHDRAINGGAATLAGTRIPVWVLESLRRQGASDAELLVNYPGVWPGLLQAAWSYVASWPEEIDRAIQEHATA